MSEKLIRLSAFDPKKSCSKIFNAILVGKKHTGKSTLIKDILYHLHKKGIPRACVFSGTEESNGFYKKFIPGVFIYDDSSVESRLNEIVDYQKKIAMQKQLGEISDDLDTRVAIVLDDVGYKKDILKSEIIRQIFMNGRHHQIILIVACQYCMDVAIDLRTNADYVYVLKQNSMSSVKNLHDNYFGAFEKKKEFQKVLDACTQDYQCLVLDNTRPSTMAKDVCFWYKAKFGRDFQFGCTQYWDFHKAWYLSDEQRFLKSRSAANQKVQKGNIVVHKDSVSSK